MNRQFDDVAALYQMHKILSRALERSSLLHPDDLTQSYPSRFGHAIDRETKHILEVHRKFRESLPQIRPPYDKDFETYLSEVWGGMQVDLQFLQKKQSVEIIEASKTFLTQWKGLAIEIGKAAKELGIADFVFDVAIVRPLEESLEDRELRSYFDPIRLLLAAPPPFCSLTQWDHSDLWDRTRGVAVYRFGAANIYKSNFRLTIEDYWTAQLDGTSNAIRKHIQSWIDALAFRIHDVGSSWGLDLSKLKGFTYVRPDQATRTIDNKPDDWRDNPSRVIKLDRCEVTIGDESAILPEEVAKYLAAVLRNGANWQTAKELGFRADKASRLRKKLPAFVQPFLETNTNNGHRLAFHHEQFEKYEQK